MLNKPSFFVHGWRRGWWILVDQPQNLNRKGRELNHGTGSPSIWTDDEAHV